MSGYVEGLLEAAREAKIKLPKSKKACTAEAEAAVEDATDGDVYDYTVALKILEDKFGAKKVTGKRKASGDDGGERDRKTAPAATVKGESKKSASNTAVLDEVWDASNSKERKAQAAKLVAIAKSRGVKMPEAEGQARMGAGRSLMGAKGPDSKYTVKDVIEDLESTYGKDPTWVDPDDSSPRKKKKPSKAKQCEAAENEPLAEMFDELAGLLFKEKSKSALVYKKVASLIKSLPEPLKQAPKKKEIAGVGPKSIDLIKEFLETGKTELLEEKRAAANEM